MLRWDGAGSGGEARAKRRGVFPTNPNVITWTGADHEPNFGKLSGVSLMINDKNLCMIIPIP